jgi:hypothetical protein
VAQIGIKLADHTFYPVLEDETPRRKRTVLSVAKEGQRSVQVDVIRRDDGNDQVVGSLVLEDLPDDSGGEVEFVLGIDSDGTVDARISDPSGEQYQSFSVNVTQLDLAESFSLPDESDASGYGGVAAVDDSLDSTDFGMPEISLPDEFDDDFGGEFEDEDQLHASLSEDLSDDLAGVGDSPAYESGLGSDADEELEGDVDEDEPAPRSFSPLLLAAIILISLSLLALGAFGIFSWLKGDAVPELRAAGAISTVFSSFLL